ncbi:sugar ABC transporter substrate-binding protein (plasmid) [Phyllobacterium sp. 628]|uniref:substrate-binding domain-containing protein n=1 Tax=Phyllobacterium sp. 628 TaxID=2718938 RepID=UPI0016627337|nr:substrate-binding domain-containing protein [Phyllobacterium sp. 628]QND54820.1 sugar ABC transporter substrate-binding protein [Phyllobacterium sp. 628]
MKYVNGLAAASVLFVGFAGCAAAAGIDGAPAPFNKGGVKVALISYISAGDFFQSYQAGAQAQASKLGIDLRIFPGKQNAAEQREQIQQAINLGVAGIVVDHGLPESIGDVVQQAVDAGIKVVAFDVNLNNPAVPQIEQSDHELARLALEQAVKENGSKFQAGYVYVAGFAPLDRRNETWEKFKSDNPDVVEKTRFGVVSDTTATSTADQAKAAFIANPDIKVVFAPYDEFARGVKLAARDLGIADKIRIYSADVSTADIQEITEEGSPWAATAATNPAVVGAVSIRAVALKIAGTDVPRQIVVKPALLTQAALREAGVKTIDELAAKVRSFSTSDAVTADWIPANLY